MTWPPMNPPSEARLDALALHVFQGGTIAAFAREAGRTERTIFRWAKMPEVADRVTTLRQEHLAAASNRLSEAGDGAVATLVGLLDAGTPQDSTRLGAAKAILANLASLSAIAEMQAKFEDLEARVNDARRH